MFTGYESEKLLWVGIAGGLTYAVPFVVTFVNAINTGYWHLAIPFIYALFNFIACEWAALLISITNER